MVAQNDYPNLKSHLPKSKEPLRGTGGIWPQVNLSLRSYSALEGRKGGVNICAKGVGLVPSLFRPIFSHTCIWASLCGFPTAAKLPGHPALMGYLHHQALLSAELCAPGLGEATLPTPSILCSSPRMYKHEGPRAISTL